MACFQEKGAASRPRGTPWAGVAISEPGWLESPSPGPRGRCRSPPGVVFLPPADTAEGALCRPGGAQQGAGHSASSGLGGTQETGEAWSPPPACAAWLRFLSRDTSAKSLVETPGGQKGILCSWVSVRSKDSLWWLSRPLY